MGPLLIIITAALVGIGGTLFLDVVMLLLGKFLGISGTNWRLVGRWIGHVPKGKFVQRSLNDAPKITGEHALGWFVHYAIGVGYGLLLLVIWGADWFAQPQVVEPLILAIVLLVLPYFIMMPGMGMGIAASRAPSPTVARIKSVFGHSTFGVGMYLTAVLLSTTS